MSSKLDKMQLILKENGLSMTAARKKVFTNLVQHQPVSMNKLIISTPDVDRSSIYRSILVFEELGIVKRIQIGWKYKLELTEKFHDHHHHITCNICHITVDLPLNLSLEKHIEYLAKRSGFIDVDHNIEITGTCKTCQINNPKLVPGVYTEVSKLPSTA